MAYSSGVFSLVAGNPVVTGTTISSTVQNNTMTDVATGLSTCVLKDGTQTTTVSVPFAEGLSVGAGKPGGAALQADLETGTSTTVWTTPGRQQFHPSASKGWAHFDLVGGINASYNVTSITDNGAGIATVVWATDFSSANYAVCVSIENDVLAAASCRVATVGNGEQAAGQVTVRCTRVSDGAYNDPSTGWRVIAFGDQA